jgi:FkbM family methyltransferase
MVQQNNKAAELMPAGPRARSAHAAIDAWHVLRTRVYGDRTWSVVRSWARLELAARGLGRVDRVAGWRVRGAEPGALSGHFGSKFIGLEYWFHTAAPRPFIIDCGANIGLAVLFFKTLYPDAEIVAFEPDAAAFASLGANVRDNAPADVTLHCAAVGATTGTTQLYANPTMRGSGAASIRPGMPAAEVVPVVQLSTYIDRPVDFLKIDVEGAEMDVLRELAAAGALARVREMVIEYHHHAFGDPDAMSALLSLLEGAAFGYFIALPSPRPFRRGAFQDVLVHAYQLTS